MHNARKVAQEKRQEAATLRNGCAESGGAACERSLMAQQVAIYTFKFLICSVQHYTNIQLNNRCIMMYILAPTGVRLKF